MTALFKSINGIMQKICYMTAKKIFKWLKPTPNYWPVRDKNDIYKVIHHTFNHGAVAINLQDEKWETKEIIELKNYFPDEFKTIPV